MKSKFLLIIIVIPLLFIAWLLVGNNYSNLVSKGKEFITNNTILTLDNSNEKNNNQINPNQDNNQENFCGDNICEPEEKESCCQDCACPAGQYCGDNNVCKDNLVFKPIPKPIKNFKIQTDLSKFTKPNMANLPHATSAKGQISQKPQTSDINNALTFSLKDGKAIGGLHIYGNKIIFSQYIFDGDKTKQKGFIYDIFEKKLEEIPYEKDIHKPDIGAYGMVWDAFARENVEGTDIYYYDPEDKQQGYISLRSKDQFSPLISGQSIAWVEQTDKGKNLFLYWIPSGKEIKVFKGGKKFFSCFDLYNGNLVFSVVDNGNENNPLSEKIYLYNIAKHNFELIVDGGNINIKDIAIWDKKISYIANNQIYVYDLNSNLTNKITEAKSNKYFISMYKNKIVWSDDRDGRLEIYYYNLDKNEEKRLTNNDVDDKFPDIYQNIVIYESGNVNAKLIQVD